MMKDYHTHPQIIQHPERFEEFVRAAEAKGIREICITDHMPLIGSRASDRIPHGRVSEYCRKAQELKEAYRDRISIQCGIEIDFHPTLCPEIEAVLKEGEFDFILGSSHLHAITKFNIFDVVTTRNEYARAMFENTILAAKSGYFNAIAHLDMHRWIFSKPDRFPLLDDGYDEKKHSDLIGEALDQIRAHGLYLEINPHFAMSTQSPDDIYPTRSIVEIALEKGVPFSYGSDAHKPEDVGGMVEFLQANQPYQKALETWKSQM